MGGRDFGDVGRCGNGRSPNAQTTHEPKRGKAPGIGCQRRTQRGKGVQHADQEQGLLAPDPIRWKSSEERPDNGSPEGCPHHDVAVKKV